MYWVLYSNFRIKFTKMIVTVIKRQRKDLLMKNNTVLPVKNYNSLILTYWEITTDKPHIIIGLSGFCQDLLK